jgi:hypothetical protein
MQDSSSSSSSSRQSVACTWCTVHDASLLQGLVDHQCTNAQLFSAPANSAGHTAHAAISVSRISGCVGSYKAVPAAHNQPTPTFGVIIGHGWSPVSDENIFRLPRPGSTTCLLCHVRVTAARGAGVLATVLLLVGLLTADALTLTVVMAISGDCRC